MNILGYYNLFMALAIAGTIGICQYPEPASGFDSDDYTTTARAGGGDRLPPAAWVINRPPSRIDNGYWTGFYWNRVEQDADWDDEGDDDEGGGYGSYGPSGQNRMLPPAYDSAAATATADAAFEEAANNVYGGGYNTYGTDYYAGVAIDEGATYRRPIFTRAHRDHRDNRLGRERHDDNRMDADRVDHTQHAHAAAMETHPGYNGHDRKMFEGDHRPAKPVSTGYQVHGGNGDRHHDHQQK